MKILILLIWLCCLSPLAAFALDTHVTRVPTEKWSRDKLSRLHVADGYQIQIFADELGDPRGMVDDNGALYVSRPDHGDILKLTKVAGKIARETLLAGFPQVSGLALHSNHLYFIAGQRVLVADLKKKKVVAKALYEGLPRTGQHPRRGIGIGPDGWLYVTIGSTCNSCVEENPESGTLLKARLEGGERRIFARGLRNTQAFDWDPRTKKLYGLDQGADMLGDNIPPEELNLIVDDADYGWPFCYGKRIPNMDLIQGPDVNRETICAKTQEPLLEMTAHSSPMAMKFLWGSAFVALHGSWNREPPAGYKVSRIVFEKGMPKRFEDFVTGFLARDGKSQMGRPAGLAVSHDGNLLISDDSNGVIYEVKPTARK